MSKFFRYHADSSVDSKQLFVKLTPRQQEIVEILSDGKQKKTNDILIAEVYGNFRKTQAIY